MSASLAKGRLTKRCHIFSASSTGPNAQENLELGCISEIVRDRQIKESNYIKPTCQECSKLNQTRKVF